MAACHANFEASSTATPSDVEATINTDVSSNANMLPGTSLSMLALSVSLLGKHNILYMYITCKIMNKVVIKNTYS